jgi:hypothetical protein
MQFMPLQYAQPTNMGQQFAGLGKALGGAQGGLASLINSGQAPPPGAAQTGLPGSPFAGPPPPGVGANMGAAGAGLPGNPAAGPMAPNIGAPPPGGNPPGGAPGGPQFMPPPGGAGGPGGMGANIAQQMNPVQLLQWLKNMSAGGQGAAPPGMPGSAAFGQAGMLPSTFGG